MTRGYDLAIVGGGTAGLVAAFGAAGVGARVCLVERARTGGDCLWNGCVPSKALLASAGLAHRMRHADDVGLEAVQPSIDLEQVMAHVRAAQERLAFADSEERLRGAGVEVLQAEARFAGPGRLALGGGEVAWRTALIATGSRPVLPQVDGLDQAEPLTTETVWDLRELPRRLVVLGGGPTGCELGQAFARLGSAVTLVELLPSLLAREEPEAADLVAERLVGDGVDVRLGTRGLRVEGDGSTRWLVVERDGTTARVAFDRILVAAGRRANTDGLGLEMVGVATDDDGSVTVNDRLRTTARRVFAAGDVTSGPPFTHVAAYQAGLVVTNALFGLRRTVSYEAVPWATFTDPEIGRVGLTEDDARQRWGGKAVVTRFDYAELDRAVCAGRAYGFVKLVGDPKGRLVGATVAAPAGGEAVAELAAWMQSGGKLDDVSQTVHAYPTFADGPKRAADEHLREKWLGERTRRVTRPVLGVLRQLDRRRS